MKPRLFAAQVFLLTLLFPWGGHSQKPSKTLSNLEYARLGFRNATIAESNQLLRNLEFPDNDSVLNVNGLIISNSSSTTRNRQDQKINLQTYSHSFIQKNDILTNDLYEPESINEKILKIDTAKIISKISDPDTMLTKLVFRRDVTGLYQLTSPTYELQPMPLLFEKIGVERNIRRPSLGGPLTLLTGITSLKTKFYKYKADFSYKDNDRTFHCLIGYIEEFSAELARVKNGSGSFSMSRSEFQLTSRFIDYQYLNSITLGADTLAKFYLSNIAEAIPLKDGESIWNGNDSDRILSHPPDWNNLLSEKDLVLSGTMGNDKFNMKTFEGKKNFGFYINNRLVTTIQVNQNPVSGQIFLPVSTRQLKIFTILASCPYNFLNRIYQMNRSFD